MDRGGSEAMIRTRVWVGVLAAIVAVPLACTSKSSSDTYLSREEMLDPMTCSKCHADHYKEWSGSMHAYAADDPVFRAMNKRGQRETNGAMGDFCVKCHAPMAVRDGLTKDGLDLDTVPADRKGVTCFFCHTVDQVTGSHDAALTSGADLTMRGEYNDPVPNTAHRASYSALHDRDQLDSAKMCGACHDIVNGHGQSLERTFAEWQASVFSHAPGGDTCGQCHMAQSASLEPIAQAPGVFARRRHVHTFAAVDLALTDFPQADAQKAEVQTQLDKTLQSALCVAATGGQIKVMLDNVAAGHAFPSGAVQDRRLWVEVTAYAAADVVYQSGAPAADGTPIVKSSDPDLWLMRDCIFDGSGKEVNMFWQAEQTDGNELPGQATFDPTDPRFYQTHIVQTYPRAAQLPKAPDRVTMRVHLQPMGTDVLDDLVASGDLDPAVRAKMATLDVGALLEWTAAKATATYTDSTDHLQYACVTDTNFNVVSDRVPAVNHTRCK
jgi:Cytochrome c554 and c-prime